MLGQLFDYAGLYPPAALSMGDATAAYERYRAGPDRWMLGPFVCGISSLTALESYRELFSIEQPLSLSLIASRGSDLSGFLKQWSTDVQTVASFAQRQGGTVKIDSVEIALPSDGAELRATAKTVLEGILEPLHLLSDLPGALFIETARDQTFASRLDVLCSAIHQIRQATPILGLKLRCGGMDSADFPTPEEVAVFLVSVIDSENRFKATAGLHHPVRKWSDEQQVTMHGFLNVFLGAALYADERIDRSRLIQVISEEDPSSFVFEDDGFRWRDTFADLEVLHRLRQSTAISIGSCSFDEPREDLSDLGWLRAGNETPRSIQSP